MEWPTYLSRLIRSAATRVFLMLVLATVVSCDQQGDEQANRSSTASNKKDKKQVDSQIAKDQATSKGSSDQSGTNVTDSIANKSLAERRQLLNETVWSTEKTAQEYEAAIVEFWDALLKQHGRADSDKFAIFKSIPLSSIKIGTTQSTEALDHSIQSTQLGGNGTTHTNEQWMSLIDRFRDEGYRLVQSEWHQSAFDARVDDNSPARSNIDFVLHVVNTKQESRLAITGKLKVEWSEKRNAKGNPVPQHIDATDMQILSRVGEPIFEEILTVDPSKPGSASGIHPLIAYDLNGDGLSEIIAGGCNRVYWNLGKGKFKLGDFVASPSRTFEVGLIADISGDGHADYVAPGIRGDLLVFEGNEKGEFLTQPKGKVRGGGPLRQPQGLTVGDIDADGDLDVWIAQYKIAYLNGQMPTPYYDANDGHPAFLLLNGGGGRFLPYTEEAGLAAKRNRRSYTSTFVDLDDDMDLDLLVVSDFAGIDVYHNDGKGFFEDVTDKLVDERHSFGMSATFGDYNLDGQIDFYIAGMSSTTARRLEYMQLGRSDRPEIHMKRMQMAYGNRMYLTGSGRYQQPTFRDQVARTGWTWGTTTLDFDNDGDPDIFAGNGHSSGKSTKDHCTHFWCHDIYESTSTPNPEFLNIFKDVHKGYLDRSESWDGYQKNVLLMNVGGKRFVNVAFLLGVGQQYDARAAISDDIDGDGRMDLLVVEDNWHDGQILHVYRNNTSATGNWLGIRLREEPGAPSPVGAKIIVKTESGNKVAHIMTGETIHGQHAPTVHFGLGALKNVLAIEVVWANGKRRRTIDKPAINQYHAVSAN